MATEAKVDGVITRQLRAFLQAQDRSGSELAQAAGLDPCVVNRFLSGRRTLKLETIDRLAVVYGLRLSVGGPAKNPKPGRVGKPKAPRSPRSVP